MDKVEVVVYVEGERKLLGHAQFIEGSEGFSVEPLPDLAPEDMTLLLGGNVEFEEVAE